MLEAASGIDAGGGFSDFIFWRGAGSSVEDEGKMFTHMGLERHRRKHRGGPVTDIFVFSGPTREQVSRWTPIACGNQITIVSNIRST